MSIILLYLVVLYSAEFVVGLFGSLAAILNYMRDGAPMRERGQKSGERGRRQGEGDRGQGGRQRAGGGGGVGGQKAGEGPRRQGVKKWWRHKTFPGFGLTRR